MVRVLLRDLGGGLPSKPTDDNMPFPEGNVSGGQGKMIVELSRVPNEGEELHWPNWIARVWKTMHFPNPTDGLVACCYVVNPDTGGETRL